MHLSPVASSCEATLQAGRRKVSQPGSIVSPGIESTGWQEIEVSCLKASLPAARKSGKLPCLSGRAVLVKVSAGNWEKLHWEVAYVAATSLSVLQSFPVFSVSPPGEVLLKWWVGWQDKSSRQQCLFRQGLSPACLRKVAFLSGVFRSVLSTAGSCLGREPTAGCSSWEAGLGSACPAQFQSACLACCSPQSIENELVVTLSGRSARLPGIEARIGTSHWEW